MKLLIITHNTNFLQWVDKYDDKVKIIKYDTDWGFRKIYKLIFYIRIRILSYFYDVIFCDFFTFLTGWTSHASSKPIYIRLHRYEIHNPNLLLNVNIKNIKTIITTSKYYKSLVIEVLGDNIPVVVIPNGIDTNIFKFDSKVNHPLKTCTLGLLIPRKRVFDLIVNNPELNINIGGKGIEKITLETIIKKFKIKAKLHGFVKLPSFYYDHDIFLMNSSDESCGVSMIEAMSCGLIPLCFSWGGIEEILPQENIYKNYAELNDKLKLLNNHSDDELLKIKHKMRKLVEEKYTLKIQVNKFIKLFSD